MNVILFLFYTQFQKENLAIMRLLPVKYVKEQFTDIACKMPSNPSQIVWPKTSFYKEADITETMEQIYFGY